MNSEEIKTKAKHYGIPIIREESHKILSELIKKYNPKHILEIGTAVGFSGSIILSSCDGDLVTLEHNKNLIKQAKKNFKINGFKSRVKIIEGDCVAEVAKMASTKKFDEYFDFIFLDGPKAQYLAMLENLLVMLKPKGVFLADNVSFRGYANNEKTPPTKRYKTIAKRLDEFIEKCKNCQKLTKFNYISAEDGLIFAEKV